MYRSAYQAMRNELNMFDFGLIATASYLTIPIRFVQ